MAALNAEQVLHLLMTSSIEELNSGEEIDIKEDLAFTLSHSGALRTGIAFTPTQKYLCVIIT